MNRRRIISSRFETLLWTLAALVVVAALATVVDDAPHTPLTPPEDDEDDGPAPLLGKKALDCLISGAVKSRRALADFLALEEGYYLAPSDRAAIDAADRIILRVLRQAREDYSLA